MVDGTFIININHDGYMAWHYRPPLSMRAANQRGQRFPGPGFLPSLLAASLGLLATSMASLLAISLSPLVTSLAPLVMASAETPWTGRLN